jgi:hypothetical protein
VIAWPVLRAHQRRSVGPGQRWLVELELTSDGKVHQRVNEGTPESLNAWIVIGRWTDLATERQRLATEGWEVD